MVIRDGSGRVCVPKMRDASDHAHTLACPFYKHDPDLHPQCSKVILKSMSYVKQHLFRKHGPSSIPPVDDLEGNTEQSATRTENNTRHDPSEPRTMTDDQLNTLKKRLPQKLKESEQWEATYRVLFSDAQDIPSPYLDDYSFQTKPLPQPLDEQERENRRRVLFQDTADKVLNIPKMYAKCAVLVLQWENDKENIEVSIKDWRLINELT